MANASGKYVRGMAILKFKYERLGVNQNIENCIELVRSEIRTLDKTKYQNTLNLYAVISQFQEAIVNPSGTLSAYSEIKTVLNNDFARYLSLAKLE
jgi:hypothetical protein